MKIRPLLIPLAVVGAFGGTVAWLVFTDPPPPPDTSGRVDAPQAAESKVEARSSEQSEPATAQAGTATSAVPPPDEIRDVSPDGVSAPEVTGNLTRIEPSERFLELMNPPVEPVPEGPLNLVHVEVLDGGHLKSGPLTVKLAHIDPLPLDATCKTEMGASWPCGTRARTFLRGLVRRFKVTCSKEEDLSPQKITAECLRGKIDLGKQLIRFGWAKPLDTAPEGLKELAEEAKAEEIGQWQTDWYSDLPESNWADQTGQEPLTAEDLAPDVIDWSLRTFQGDATTLLDDPVPEEDLLTDELPEQ
ncbi:thermonuclease family protein [Roseibium sp.]|uniref:thermonuclease family protein n=1 Tax=Roseibium sp. TaxID=1936156 RepID=UPI003B51F398